MLICSPLRRIFSTSIRGIGRIRPIGLVGRIAFPHRIERLTPDGIATTLH